MVKDLVNESALKYIIKDVELTLLRLGIKTDVALVEGKDYKGESFETVVSTDFQTTPVIFKKINIEGSVRAKVVDGCIKVVFNLDYRVQTFENGYNGFTLGRIVYDVDKSYNGKHPENAHFYIDKVESIKL